jgi:hypothetical protein
MVIPPERIQNIVASSLDIAAQVKEVNALRERVAQAQAKMQASQRSIQESGTRATATRPQASRKSKFGDARG